MKRSSCVLGVFFCLFLSFFSLSVSADAAVSAIDAANASSGNFQIYYEGDSTRRMKVGVTCGGETTYYNYTAGDCASYAFTKGDGTYTITLYRQVSGTSYSVLERSTVAVTLGDPLAPYLASTAEISFAEGSAVASTAAQLCEGLESSEEKIVALHNYIADNFSYDYDFAAQVLSGCVKNYTPNTDSILSSKKGVCYDLSALFAAMCRSQGIPCAMVKGQMYGGSHAWNMVYVNGQWVALDLTLSVSRLAHAAQFSDCVCAQEGYYSAAF